MTYKTHVGHKARRYELCPSGCEGSKSEKERFFPHQRRDALIKNHVRDKPGRYQQKKRDSSSYGLRMTRDELGCHAESSRGE